MKRWPCFPLVSGRIWDCCSCVMGNMWLGSVNGLLFVLSPSQRCFLESFATFCSCYLQVKKNGILSLVLRGEGALIAHE